MNTIIQSNEITVEAIEALAARLEADEATTRAKLLRLIKAEARILALREPGEFRRHALEYADEDGHYDSSFPPKQVYRDKTGPSLFEVDRFDYEENATTSGFYYAWEAATTDAGIYVDRKGTIYGAEITGTGRLGQFAAHPGNCGVLLAIEWSPRDLDDVTTEALRTVEAVMRAKAFPTSAG